MQGFHLEYLHYGEQDKHGSRGKKYGIADRLLRLANDATLREELTSFPLAPSADGAIPAAHRPGAYCSHPSEAVPPLCNSCKQHMVRPRNVQMLARMCVGPILCSV